MRLKKLTFPIKENPAGFSAEVVKRNYQKRHEKNKNENPQNNASPQPNPPGYAVLHNREMYFSLNAH